MEKCLYCNGENNSIKSKFCSTNHYQLWRYHNTEYGLKVKERVRLRLRERRKSLDFRNAEKIRWQNWLNNTENRKRWNEYMKNYMRNKKR